MSKSREKTVFDKIISLFPLNSNSSYRTTDDDLGDLEIEIVTKKLTKADLQEGQLEILYKIIEEYPDDEIISTHLMKFLKVDNLTGLDEKGMAPIHRAALEKDADKMRLLLRGGADPKIKSEEGNNVTHYLMMNCQITDQKVSSIIREFGLKGLLNQANNAGYLPQSYSDTNKKLSVALPPPTTISTNSQESLVPKDIDKTK